MAPPKRSPKGPTAKAPAHKLAKPGQEAVDTPPVDTDLEELAPRLILGVKMETFCQEFVKGVGKQKAAINAGYPAAGAATQATRLLKKDKIRERIAELQEEAARACAITVKSMLISLHRGYQRCLQAEEIIAKDGTPTGMFVFNATGAAALGKLVLSNLPDGVGEKVANLNKPLAEAEAGLKALREKTAAKLPFK